jgi:2,4-dienoyl-CoA reductase-like NADH-dependent reductase (Old Yellow Enzyme family)
VKGEFAMRDIFEQTEIKGMTLANRLVRSATWEGMCGPDGRPTEKLIACYRELARGGVGLIISGNAAVRPDGKQYPGTMGIHADGFADDMKNIARAVHDEGGKICVQLVHAGGQTTAKAAGRQPLAPSAVEVEQFPEVPREMTADDISEMVSAFGAGARRVRDWGFDAVQLHAAHGYLINQFLSPLTNRRTDGYGGGAEARCRFLMEVCGEVRRAVGADFPVMVKLSGSDNVEGGLTLEDSLKAAKLLDEGGIDVIEVSGGTPASGERGPVRTKIKSVEEEAYNFALARKVREGVSAPVISVGGYRSFDVVEGAIRDDVDYVALSRPLIREPALPRRWQKGDRARATCISCNKCFKPGIKEGGIYCVVEKKEQEREKRD